MRTVWSAECCLEHLVWTIRGVPAGNVDHRQIWVDCSGAARNRPSFDVIASEADIDNHHAVFVG